MGNVPKSFKVTLPGELLSKFTIRKAIRMELIMWCKHQNVLVYKPCTVENVFWGHNIVQKKKLLLM